MNHKGLFILNSFYRHPSNLYKIERLQECFLKYGITMETRDALSLSMVASGDSLSIPGIEDYDFAIDLDKDIYLARAVSLKIPMFNSYHSLLLSDDKMSSILALYQAGVKAPKTISAPLCYTERIDEEVENRFYDLLERELSYPMVYKACHGSLGKQVKLISSRKELQEMYRLSCHQEHLYEEYLDSHAGDDYRLIVVDHKVIAVMERKNEHDFRSNIALGGKGYDVTDSIEEVYKEVAIKASEALDLDYAGIDLARGKNGEPLFLEANGNAFFTEVEKVTHIDIANEVVKMIINRIYQKK